MAKRGDTATVAGGGSWSVAGGDLPNGSRSVDVVFKRSGVEQERIVRTFTAAGISLVGTPVSGAGAGAAITLPSGRAVDDIIVLVRSTATAPSGYTQKATDNYTFSVCWRRATNTSADNVTVGNGVAYSCAIYRGCVASGDPFEAASAVASGDSAAGAVTLASITTLTANAWVLAAAGGLDVGWDDGGGGAGANTGPTWAAATGAAVTLDASATPAPQGGGSVHLGAALYHSLKTTTGATGTGGVRFYMTGYSPYAQGTTTAGALLALKPA